MMSRFCEDSSIKKILTLGGQRSWSTWRAPMGTGLRAVCSGNCQRSQPPSHSQQQRICQISRKYRYNVPLLGRSHGIGLLAVQMVVPGSGADRSDGGSSRGRGEVEGRAGILSSTGCRGSSSLDNQSVHGLETRQWPPEKPLHMRCGFNGLAGVGVVDGQRTEF